MTERFTTPSALYDCVDPEIAQKIFRSQASFDVELSPEFQQHRRVLGYVYSAIVNLIHQSSQIEYPTLREIHAQTNRLLAADRARIPGPTLAKLTRLLLILANNPRPFVHLLAYFPMPELRRGLFIQRIAVLPAKGYGDLVATAYRYCALESEKSIQAGVNLPELYTDWEALHKRFAGGKEFRREYLSERLDWRTSKLLWSQGGDVNARMKIGVIKPLLRRLVGRGLVFRFDDLRGPGRSTCLLLRNNERIEKRRRGLLAILRLPRFEGQIGAAELAACFSPEERPAATAPRIPPALPAGLAGEMLAEALSLRDWAAAGEKQDRLRREIAVVAEMLEKIKAQGGLFTAKSGGQYRLEERTLRRVLAHDLPGLLVCGVPFDGERPTDPAPYRDFYFLKQDRASTARAIDFACEHFDKREDGYYLRVMEEILDLHAVGEAVLKTYVAPIQLAKLRHYLDRMYRRRLSLPVRLWLWLFGRPVSAETLLGLRARERRENLIELRQRRARSRPERPTPARPATVPPKTTAPADVGPTAGTGQDLLAKLIDDFWRRGERPTREMILQACPADRRSEVTGILDAVDRGSSHENITRIKLAGQVPAYLITTNQRQRKLAEAGEQVWREELVR